MKKSLLPLLGLILLAGCKSATEPEWITIFDGTSLEGWRASENKGSFYIENDILVSEGERSHLFYEGDVNNATFRNFEFKADVKTSPNGNSGIYFHTEYQEEGWPSKGYEVQISNTHEGNPDGYIERKKTGSLYGIRNLYMQFVPDNEWFNIHIQVKGKRIKVFVNEIQVVDYIEPTDPVRNEGFSGRLLDEGTMAIQAHDPDIPVYFKNIMIKPLPDDAEFDDVRDPVDPTYNAMITRLHLDGFPLIDAHVHLKDGMTMEQALTKSMIDGINYGIAVNCGLDFEINTDEKLKNYINQNLEALPIFKAMQAEGREWVDIFSEEAINHFDYVFTDAMTYTEADGNRVHLWIPEEVHIDDKQAFMDMYVRHIVNIVTTEPIDIYVNATYLPDSIAGEYDALWTPERMDKVIDALVSSGVAFEINDRYKIPNKEFIKRAKAKGVKFSFGTNNTSYNDLNRLEYCLEMIEECNLTVSDMFIPTQTIN